MPQNSILVVRGGGELASGVIHRLFRCGYRVLILERGNQAPSAEKYPSVKLFMTEKPL